MVATIEQSRPRIHREDQRTMRPIATPDIRVSRSESRCHTPRRARKLLCCLARCGGRSSLYSRKLRRLPVAPGFLQRKAVFEPIGGPRRDRRVLEVHTHDFGPSFCADEPPQPARNQKGLRSGAGDVILRQKRYRRCLMQSIPFQEVVFCAKTDCFAFSHSISVELRRAKSL